MSTLAGDLRYALRAMRANPGYTAVALASLAFGIGVNTAIFSAVDQALLKTLPVPEPRQLVSVKGSRIQSYPFYKEFRDRNQVFSGLIASNFGTKTGVRAPGSNDIELADLNWVSGNYFHVLRVGAARGRVLTPEDDLKPGGSPVAVLSYRYWQKRFAGSPGVVGSKIAVNGFPLEIVGIVQKGFDGLFLGDSNDLFSPITMMPSVERGKSEVWNSPNMFWLWVMGRLNPGVSIDQSRASLRVLQPQVEDHLLGERRPDGRPRRQQDAIEVIPGAQGAPFRREAMSDPLRVLAAATGFVLLIVCANVANLLLARAAGRRKEVAVRFALGATRRHVIQQLLIESVTLALAGAIIGVALAYWGVEALAAVASWGDELRLRPDLRLLLFATGTTLLTGVIFGIVPALRATSGDFSSPMKDAGTNSRTRFRLAKGLIAAQVALSLALLAGAGLFLRTLANLRGVDAGYRRENVIVADIDPSDLGYSGHRLRTFYDRLIDGVRNIPGVRAASLSGMTPLGSYARSQTFSAEGHTPKPGEKDLIAYTNPVSNDYFSSLGIPILLGRDFRPNDEPVVTPGESFLSKIGRSSGSSNEAPSVGAKVAIVSEDLARKVFGDGNPVGKRISFEDRYTAESSLEIVGVVHDVRYGTIKRQDDLGMIYTPSWGQGADPRFLIVRAVNNPKDVVPAIRAELREIDAAVPVLRTKTMEENFNGQVGRERMLAFLTAFFGLASLLLAALGLYGVMAYAVAQRTREVGIRVALGAGRREIVGMIVRESLAPVLVGIAAGVAAAFATNRLIAGLLFGVAPRDPLSILISAAVLVLVGFAAAAIPARRASLVEPTVALRCE